MLTLKSLIKFLCGLENPFICHLDLGGGGSAPPPDPLIGKAAEANAEVAKDALAWYKETYANDLKPRQAETDKLAAAVTQDQLDTSALNKQRANEQWDRFQKLFAPVEEQMVADATKIDSQAEQARAAGEAGAQVEKSFAAADDQNARRLASMGINPNSGRALAVGNATGLTKAAVTADAMNNARQVVRDKGIALRAGAANFGRNMPNTASNAYTVGMNANSGATGANLAANSQAVNNANFAGQGFNTAIQGNSSAGNMMLGQYGQQVNAWNAQQQADAAGSAGMGQLAGQLSTSKPWWITSSRKSKTKTSGVDDSATLDDVKSLPVDRWKYKGGEGDGGEHVGAYAEDVNRKFGEQAAPGGKVIDMISMHGIALSAIKGVAKQTDKLEKQVDKLESRMASIAGQGIKRR